MGGIMAEQGIVNIHGKEYKTVARRVSEFREQCPPSDGWCIRTWLVYHDDNRVVVSASICDKEDHVVATGLAEEDRNAGKINRTSALENCETSAIGRALAAFGLGGEEDCSADELVRAIAQQGDKKSPNRNGVQAPNPTGSQPAPEESGKFFGDENDDKAEILTLLSKLEELKGENETQVVWQTILKHNTNGAMKLDDISNDELSVVLSSLRDTVETTEKNKEEQNG
jgi:hypothetical protein